MLAEGPNERGLCWPHCVFFKCGQRALKGIGQTVRCLWINDDCIGSSCSYAFCVRGKMLEVSRCGLAVRRVTVEAKMPDDGDIGFRIKGKLARRLGEGKDYL